MNIIIPKSNKVDQFLVDVRDGYVSNAKNDFKDLTDKVLYFPKSIFSDGKTVPTYAEIQKQLVTRGTVPISSYLQQRLKKLALMRFFYHLNFDYDHLKSFEEAFKNSLLSSRIKVFSLDESRIINAELARSACNENQDMNVEVKTAPENLGVEQSVIEISKLKFWPILVDELVKTL